MGDAPRLRPGVTNFFLLIFTAPQNNNTFVGYADGFRRLGPKKKVPMKVQLSKDFSFEAAHRLPNVPADNKCARLHGHSFKVVITVEGEVDSHTGWFIDYADISTVVKPLLDQFLDHRYLNEIDGLANPTSEKIAEWIWNRLNNQLTGLRRVTISETCTTACHYEGQ